MALLPQPIITVSYNDKDISADVSKYLTDFTYTDKEHGASDEISLSFEDKKLQWQNDWYPDKGARLNVSFGFKGRMVPAGIFQINSFDLEFPPDIVTLGGIATGITTNVRTKKSTQHENKTLSQIVTAIAQANNFTVAGDIAEINIARCTQNKETDLGFLKRLAETYGYVFSLRDSTITFHDVYALEGVAPIASIDKTQMVSGSFKNQITKTYKKGHLQHTKSRSKIAIDAGISLSDLPANAMQDTDSVDSLEVHDRAEDQLQAYYKIKAHLHKKNKKISELEFTMGGNPYAVAGNNIAVTGCGVLSGIYHITESKHKTVRGSGYQTTCNAHKITNPASGTLRPAQTNPLPATRSALNG